MGKVRVLASKLKGRVKSVLYRCLPNSWLVSWTLGRWPRSVTLEVTTHCNLNCPLCPTHIHARSDRWMQQEQVMDVIDTCDKRLRAVSFHMLGEPLLYKGLFSLVRSCSERGISTGFSTNGMLMDRYQQEILDSGLNFFSVAIDGCNAEDYDKYRVGGNFDQVTGSLRQLLSVRAARGQSLPMIQIQTIMFPHNEERETEVVQFLRSFGADSIRLKRPSYCAEGDGIEAPPEALEFLEIAGNDREQKRYSRNQLSAGVLYRDRALCPQLERAGVLSDGRVVACSMDSTGQTTFGNLSEQSFAEIWKGRRHQERIQEFLDGKLNICRHCNLS